MSTFNTVDDIKRAHRGHFFDADTMRFFKSRILEGVHTGPGGVVFITSERGPHMERACSVRLYLPDRDDFRTVGPFNKYSAALARKLAADTAAGFISWGWEGEGAACRQVMRDSRQPAKWGEDGFPVED